MKRKVLLLLGALSLLTGLSWARPLPVWRLNYPTDGSIVTKTTVTCSSTTSTVLVSSNTNRAALFAQVISCPSTTDKVYWDITAVSTSTSFYVNPGDYFTPDDPIGHTGGVYVRDTSGGCKVTALEWSVGEVNR